MRTEDKDARISELESAAWILRQALNKAEQSDRAAAKIIETIGTTEAESRETFRAAQEWLKARNQ